METKKPKIRKVIDSTDSESEDSEANNSLKRKSVRISQKRNKPEFHLPSRNEIWKNIPSMKEELSLKRLTPKKTVNNFTKIYNDYNFDDYEDTSESISSDESLEDEETSSKKQEKKHRISNYYSRIVKVSSSDEEQTIEHSDPQMSCTPSKNPNTNDPCPDNVQEKHKKWADSESDVPSSPCPDRGKTEEKHTNKKWDDSESDVPSSPCPDRGKTEEKHTNKKWDDSESDVSSSPGRPKRTRAKKKLYAFPLSEDEESDS